MPLGQRQLWVVGLCFFDPDHINLEEVSFKYFTDITWTQQ